ncbi:ABC transporter permease [Sungkyunkwania multivorans]|uniref:Transport permease protein n=1 Tax=Sungkyunkwania multivorans TaxID=1173618 RepID=A0ABW3D2I1_9FLAO
MSKTTEEKWLFEITPKRGLFELNFKEIWQYRDLLFLFVKRDIVTVYKQTILGPLWFFIQPLFTSVIFTLIFNNVANIQTPGVPSLIFNMAGITIWNYFKVCLTDSSNTFRSNQGIFSKVYFPRVIVPLSKVMSNLMKFGIQLLIIVSFYIYYVSIGKEIRPSVNLLLLPLLIVILALFGLGFGMILSSMTTKYRDLNNLITFGTQLLMYLSAVMYPIQVIREKIPKYAWLVEYNPLAIVIESFRYMIFSSGDLNYVALGLSLLASILVFLFGLMIFNKAEKNFIDTV